MKRFFAHDAMHAMALACLLLIACVILSGCTTAQVQASCRAATLAEALDPAFASRNGTIVNGAAVICADPASVAALSQTASVSGSGAAMVALPAATPQ